MKIILALLVLTGCQAFHPPPESAPQLPAAYRFQTGAELVREQWWREFQSPTLNTLIEEALAQAPDIRVARARLDQARAAAARTGSQLQPALGLEADAAAVWNKPDTRNVIRTETYGLGLAASYELDLWGRVRAVRQADLLLAAAGEHDLRTATLTLSAEIVEAWILLQGVRQQLEVISGQQETNAAILSSLELRFANSLASALDVLQQREAMAQTDALKPPLLAEATRLENRIALLLGKAPGSLDLPAAELPASLPLPDAGLPADLLDQRPDIQAQWLRLGEAGWDLTAARADRLPAVRLSGKFEHSGAELSRILDNWVANLAAALTAPLFDGGARQAEVRRQEAIRAERLALYEKTVFTALTEVDSAYSSALRQQELLLALDIQADAAQQAQRSAVVRYQNGVQSYDTVLSLLLKLQQLERTRVQAQAALLIQQAGLCRALGKGWHDNAPISPIHHPTDLP